MKRKKFLLDENDVPRQWYNIQAEMPNKPMPPLNPATHKPLHADDLAHIFNQECSRQELDQEHAWIDIPDEVRDKYCYYRATPLVRAYALEKALDTKAHIYFKNESTNPLGSHKINSALPQCYYCKQEGDTNVTTETGAGQWGPSMSTRAGKNIITADPNHPGSLGTAISEAIELATTTPGCKYTLGSVLNHVALHQTVIGLEAEKQMEMAGEYPDEVIACFGGGSNFGGIAFPFMRHVFDGTHKDTKFIAAEPNSCPKLTRGKFEYDFGDEAGYTPLLPMFTLGHDFKPANIHAGGLRYHGAGVIISQLLKDGYLAGMDIPQLESFAAGVLFAQTEGIIPAPESCHAIAATIREAKRANVEGKAPVILFNLSGHGLIDMPSYMSYINGDLANYTVTDDEIEKNLEKVPLTIDK